MVSRTSSIVEELRQEIVQGRLAPGSKLPSQRDLAERFGMAGVTVRTALKTLEREGFIEARERSGTFVVEKPPHTSQIALVFTFDPAGWFADEYWSRYYQALVQAAMRYQQESGRRMLMFHGIDQHSDSEDRERLIAYMRAHRVAGVIFANTPFMLANTPILDLPGIPRVAIGECTGFAGVQAIRGTCEIDQVLDHFATLGRRRIALIDHNAGPTAYHEHWETAMAAREMVSHRRWRQIVSLRAPSGARNAVELLMHDVERPDALYINDDNFVEHALCGLLDAGVRVPEEIAVVGHANFPLAPSKLLPMRLIGYDAHLILQQCVASIDRQRAGDAVAEPSAFSCLWEEELASPNRIASSPTLPAAAFAP